MHGLRRVTHLRRANFVKLEQVRSDVTLKPVKGLGRKIPVMLTTSPGLMVATSVLVLEKQNTIGK